MKLFKKRNKTPLVFEVKGKTTQAEEALLNEARSNPKTNKKEGDYELVQENPPILIVKHNILGSTLSRMASQLGTSPEMFIQNKVWQNQVIKKVTKKLEKNTDISRKEFDVKVRYNE